MLILTRKPGESVRIGDDIQVRVIHLRANQVRLAIEAPDDVRILRGELAEWIYEGTESSPGSGQSRGVDSPLDEPEGSTQPDYVV